MITSLRARDYPMKEALRKPCWRRAIIKTSKVHREKEVLLNRFCKSMTLVKFRWKVVGFPQVDHGKEIVLSAPKTNDCSRRDWTIREQLLQGASEVEIIYLMSIQNMAYLSRRNLLRWVRIQKWGQCPAWHRAGKPISQDRMLFLRRVPTLLLRNLPILTL